MSHFPFVSIIIPAFNEAKYLPLCLEAITQGAYPRDRFEILVIDNGSTDGTQQIAEKFADFLLARPEVSVSAVRNFGAEKARGEILAFLDADCVPVEDWLENAVSRLSKENCLTGSRYSNPPDSTWITRCWFPEARESVTSVHALSGGNILLRKEVFGALGGFDESLKTGEDAEFCARARKLVPIVDDPSIKVFHYGVPRTLGEFFRREIWLGLGAFGTFRLNFWDKPLLGTLAFLALFAFGILGLFRLLLSGSSWLFFSALGLMGGLFLVTLLYRRHEIRTPLRAVQMCTLYVLYYGGRSISLLLLLCGGNFYHHNKKLSKISHE